jgi:hypothetical protein
MIRATMRILFNYPLHTKQDKFMILGAGENMSDNSSELHERLHGAFRYFDAACLNDGSLDNGALFISLVDPEIFLRLASPVSERIARERRSEAVEAVLDAGTPFSSIPELLFTAYDDGTAAVFGHEGRHRAMALRDRGVREIPVLLLPEYYLGDGSGFSGSLEAIEKIYPQSHDDDESYDLDAGELNDRLDPLPFREIFAVRFSITEVQECLDVGDADHCALPGNR